MQMRKFKIILSIKKRLNLITKIPEISIMEMCITGHSTDGKHHSKHRKKPCAFPHPLNNVSHSSVTRPVIHSSTMPAIIRKITCSFHLLVKQIFTNIIKFFYSHISFISFRLNPIFSLINKLIYPIMQNIHIFSCLHI